MAYTLKSTGIATNLTVCIAVDSDGTVKDFVSGSAVTMSWVDASDVATAASTGATQWRSATSNSSSHKYFTTSTARFLKFGTKPTFGGASSAARSIFLAYGPWTRSNAGGDWVFNDSSQRGLKANGFGAWEFVEAFSQSRSWATSVAASGSTQNTILGMISGSSGASYLNGSSDGGSTANGNNGTYTPDYIGRDQGGSGGASRYFAADYFCIAQFNADVTSSASALNTDWFGTLFNGSSAVAPIAGRHYAQLRNQ